MDRFVLFYALLSAINLSIASYVYLKDRSRQTNQIFGLLGAAIAIWTLAIGLAYNPSTTNLSLVRLTFASASLMLLGLVTFFLVFPSSTNLRSPKYFAFNGLCLIFSGLAFSPLLVRELSEGADGPMLVYGSLHPYFGAFVYASFASSIFILWKKFHRTTGIQRLQFRYLLLGLLLPAIAIAITNLLIPLLFSTSQFGRYGPAFTLIFVCFTAHVIIRHRLMNIRLFIRKGSVYVASIVVVASVFLVLASLLSTIARYDTEGIPLITAMAMAVAVAIFFQPLKRRIQDSLNRYVYREIYDYPSIVRETSRRLSTILDLQSLLTYLTEVLSKTLRVELVAVYLRDHPQHTFSPRVVRWARDVDERTSGHVPSGKSPLICFLEAEKRMLIHDEAFRHPQNNSLMAATTELQALGGEIAIPFSTEQGISGFLLVGSKLSGDPYFSEDVDLLITLASQAATAIENAQLYRQVVLVNEYVENILATMESGVAAVASDGTVTLFNSAAARMTHLDAKEIRGSRIAHLPPSLAEPLEATLADGQPRTHIETLIQDVAGGLTPAICSSTSLKDKSGTILGAVAVFSDLTRLKELEGEKRRAERLASIGALASAVAHEIKNPLVAIRTFAELLPERFAEEDFQGEFSKIVIREIKRIDDLVARLRGLARPPAQPLSPVDLRDPIRETLALLHGQLKKAHITVKSIYDGDLPLVAGDPAQLKQLFLNLFMNAVEAMAPGGELSVRLVGRHGPTGNTIITEISDTGTGIPEALLSKMFDPFVTTKQQGSGLGLSICRGIADAHRATIRAQNRPNGTGAVITLEFPAMPERISTELETSRA